MQLVVIRADASTKVGSGHVMRCLTLAKRLRKEKNAQVIFVMRELSGNLIGVAKNQGFEVLALPPAEQQYQLEGYGLWLTVPMELDAQQTKEALQGYLKGCNANAIDRLVVD